MGPSSLVVCGLLASVALCLAKPAVLPQNDKTSTTTAPSSSTPAPLVTPEPTTLSVQVKVEETKEKPEQTPPRWPAVFNGGFRVFSESNLPPRVAFRGPAYEVDGGYPAFPMRPDFVESRWGEQPAETTDQEETNENIELAKGDEGKPETDEQSEQVKPPQSPQREHVEGEPMVEEDDTSPMLPEEEGNNDGPPMMMNPDEQTAEGEAPEPQTEPEADEEQVPELPTGLIEGPKDEMTIPSDDESTDDQKHDDSEVVMMPEDRLRPLMQEQMPGFDSFPPVPIQENMVEDEYLAPWRPMNEGGYDMRPSIMEEPYHPTPYVREW